MSDKIFKDRTKAVLSASDPYEITDAVRVTLDRHLSEQFLPTDKVELLEYVQECPDAEPHHSLALILNGMRFKLTLTSQERIVRNVRDE